MKSFVYFFNSDLRLVFKSQVETVVDDSGNASNVHSQDDYLTMLSSVGGSYLGFLEEDLPQEQVGWVNGRVTKIAVPIEKFKADKIESINAERERRGVLPITFQGIEWDADEFSQRNISAWMASIAAGVAIPPGFTWRAADNTNHAADAAFINGLGAAITLRGTLLYQTSWGKKAEVAALTTVDAVKAYDVTAGW
jgi:hypothetical protein